MVAWQLNEMLMAVVLQLGQAERYPYPDYPDYGVNLDLETESLASVTMLDFV